MKIGIVSCYYNHNYGSMLQAYATQEIIKKMGDEVVTIQCCSPITYMEQSKLRYYYHKIINSDIVKAKVRQYQSKRKMRKHVEVIKGISVRNVKFDSFAKKSFYLSDLSNTRKELEALADSFDAVVVGSDMLWHPVNVEHDYYTLSFVPETVKKIAYATSFGTTQIPNYQVKKYRTFLKRFSAISVREKSGVEVIKKLDQNLKVEIVLDPTLLFTGKEWMKIQDKNPIVAENYIFCYFLGVNEWHRRIAKRISEYTGYKILMLPHLDEFVESDLDFADQFLYNIDPAEFINLIRNASFVCTDSFHGTCFSILNHRKFFTFNRFQDNNSQSTNTRIDSLLSTLGLSDRRINNESVEISKLLSMEINYNDVDEILENKRKRSIEFLKNSLHSENTRGKLN